MKMRAREEKKKDKEHAKISKDTFEATFDLQAVLQTPCSIVSQIYYSVFFFANSMAECMLSHSICVWPLSRNL
jgi:hypothetical protein